MISRELGGPVAAEVGVALRADGQAHLAHDLDRLGEPAEPHGEAVGRYVLARDGDDVKCVEVGLERPALAPSGALDELAVEDCVAGVEGVGRPDPGPRLEAVEEAVGDDDAPAFVDDRERSLAVGLLR